MSAKKISSDPFAVERQIVSGYRGWRLPTGRSIVPRTVVPITVCISYIQIEVCLRQTSSDIRLRRVIYPFGMRYVLLMQNTIYFASQNVSGGLRPHPLSCSGFAGTYRFFAQRKNIELLQISPLARMQKHIELRSNISRRASARQIPTFRLRRNPGPQKNAAIPKESGGNG